LKILVTGGSGFIGSYLVNELLARGNEVAVIDLKSLENPMFPENTRATYFEGDICDASLVNQLVYDVDQVYHLASSVGVVKIMSNPIDGAVSTIIGGLNVLKACRKFKKRILITSTSEIYGKSMGGKLKEDADRVLGQTQYFRWSYSESKALLENTAYALSSGESSYDFVIARLFNTVGAGQLSEHGMVIPRFVQAALKDETLLVFGDGKQTRTFCDVRDVVRALVELMNCGEIRNDVFNVGSNTEISIHDLALKVIQLSKSYSKIKTVPYSEAYPPGYEDMTHRLPDISKIHAVINWKRSYNLDETIQSVIEHERSRLN
jgi:UDP-glucose 4-epimerase